MIIPRNAKLAEGTYLPVREIHEAFADGSTYHYSSQQWIDPDHVHADAHRDLSGGWDVWTCGADLRTCEPFLGQD